MARRLRGAISVSLFAVLAVTTTAAAQTSATPAPDPHAAQPERPTVATHAGTVAPGWLEIEAGGEWDRFGDRTNSGSVPTLFKLGLASRLQLSIQTPTVRPAGVRSVAFGDASVGVKWRVLEHAPILGDFAVLPTIKFPTGSSDTGAGTGTTDGSLLLISSHQLGPVAMDLNVGFTHRSGNGEQAPRSSTVWTASFGGPAVGTLGWCAELYGYPRTTGRAGADSIVAVLAGPTWAARDWLVFDAGVIVRITGDQPRAVYAGLTWNVAGPRK